MEKRKKRSLIKYLFLTGLLAFVWIHYRSFLADAWREIRNLSAWQLTAVVLLSLGYQLLEGGVIWLMMKRYVPDYRYQRGARCALVCSFYRFATLGSGGMAAEIVELSKDGADSARAGGMSMVQYLIHKITITVYGIAAFFYLLLFTDSNVRQYSHFLWIGTVMTGLIAAFLILICTSRRFSGFCFAAANKAAKGRGRDRLERLREQVGILQDEARALLRPMRRENWSRGGKRGENSDAGRRKSVLKWILLLDFGKLTCWYLVPCVVIAGNANAPFGEILALTASAQMLAGVIPAPAGIGSLEFVFLLFSARAAGESLALSAMLLLRAAINLIPFLPGLLLSVMPDKNRGKFSGLDVE